MAEKWDEDRLQKEFIDAKAAENQRIEYKGAGALENTPGKKDEIVKDITAMANATGGFLFYGIKENKAAADQPGIPEAIDPITDTRLSRDWLIQVVNNAAPPILGLHVEAVPLKSGGFVLVVEIPQGVTAHQARDGRYYRRYTIENKWMPNDQVLDVMNRRTLVRVGATFSHSTKRFDWDLTEYVLEIIIQNTGYRLVNHFKLAFGFPDLDQLSLPVDMIVVGGPKRAELQRDGKKMLFPHSTDQSLIGGSDRYGRRWFTLRSKNVLFPGDETKLSETCQFKYLVNAEIRHLIDRVPSVKWKLFADDMPSDSGELSFRECVDHGER